MVDDQLPYEHLFSISALSPGFVCISNYLVARRLHPNISFWERSRIIRKSAPFTSIGGNLFNLGPDQIVKRCVREEEVFDIIYECHDSPCGGQFSVKTMTYKVL